MIQTIVETCREPYYPVKLVQNNYLKESFEKDFIFWNWALKMHLLLIFTKFLPEALFKQKAAKNALLSMKHEESIGHTTFFLGLLG